MDRRKMIMIGCVGVSVITLMLSAPVVLLGNALDQNLGKMGKPITDRVFFDIEIDGEPRGRIEMGLYGTVVPKTVKNFVELCRGGKTGPAGEVLHYKGSTFHRIIPKFMMQGGDFTRGDGTGGMSIYGEKFEDENFVVKHETIMQLSMANSGPNTNGSQFYITMTPARWLDGKHVVFGEVLSHSELLQLIEALGSQTGKPRAKVRISDSGVLEEM